MKNRKYLKKPKKPKNLQAQMQWTFSLNNLVSRSVSNPGDGASDVVL
jgi:hypothetical protein